MTPVLEVIAPGLLTTVQDRGRHGYQAFGMPVAGAVDEYALRIANTVSYTHLKSMYASSIRATLMLSRKRWRVSW